MEQINDKKATYVFAVRYAKLHRKPNAYNCILIVDSEEAHRVTTEDNTGNYMDELLYHFMIRYMNIAVAITLSDCGYIVEDDKPLSIRLLVRALNMCGYAISQHTVTKTLDVFVIYPIT